MKIESVVVPLDGTLPALAAVPVANALADTVGATLHVLHVCERPRRQAALLRSLGLSPEEMEGFVLDQRTGRPAQGILRYAGELRHPTVVICTHTGMEKPRGTIGSVAEEVILGAHCPVVLVQPERGLEPWALRRILLPHDGTPATTAAMDPAGDLAELTGAEVLVVYVAAPGEPAPTEPGSFAAPRYLDQPQHEWPAWASEFISRMSALGHPTSEVQLTLLMAAGDPGEQIVRVSREHESDLVVLAWHGSWEPRRAATMKRVIREAHCPVLLVRAARPRRGE